MKRGSSPTKARREAYRQTVERLAVEERCAASRYSYVLDFGCGTGWLVQHFCSGGSNVVGLEVRPGPLREAQARCSTMPVLFALYGGGILPLRDSSVDLVLAVGVVRSLLDRGPLALAAQEWFRCLKPGGRLLLIETDNRALWRYMRAHQIRDLLIRCGFEPLAWYPIRKVSWWGVRLVKWGLFPHGWYEGLGRWELHRRKRDLGGPGKKAYLGDFRRPVDGADFPLCGWTPQGTVDRGDSNAHDKALGGAGK